ncbi:MAG: DUF2019 domain-containing protein [Erysipelotrichaceae bacterium]|nr:DUF2019 domain-containing protein [Erysipelotrichaceae bacterium]
MEHLFVHALLWRVDLESGTQYNERLDHMFLEEPDSEFLLILENNSGDNDATYRSLFNFSYRTDEFNASTFHQTLMERLRFILDSKAISKKEFKEKCQMLWENLPEHLQSDEIRNFIENEIVLNIEDFLIEDPTPQVKFDPNPKKKKRSKDNNLQAYSIFIVFLLWSFMYLIAPQYLYLTIVPGIYFAYNVSATLSSIPKKDKKKKADVSQERPEIIQTYLNNLAIINQMTLNDYDDKEKVKRCNKLAAQNRKIATDIEKKHPEYKKEFAKLLSHRNPKVRLQVAHHMLEVMTYSTEINQFCMDEINQIVLKKPATENAGNKQWIKDWYDDHPDHRSL